jgi:GMP synthase (glutamine-hydrolysing)
VALGSKREYGLAVLYQGSEKTPLFDGLPDNIPVWMSHGDRIEEMPPGFNSLAYTDNSPIAAMGNDQEIIGLQFHPEVVHTPQGKEILRNFLYKICGCSGTWTPGSPAASSMRV